MKELIYKIIVIVKSRFEKPKNQKWVEDRRKICKFCPLNTKNSDKIPLKIKFIIYISDFYTWLTRKPKTDLGNCGICGCDLYYQTQSENDSCSDTPPKWKSIYIPNKK